MPRFLVVCCLLALVAGFWLLSARYTPDNRAADDAAPITIGRAEGPGPIFVPVMPPADLPVTPPADLPVTPPADLPVTPPADLIVTSSTRASSGSRPRIQPAAGALSPPPRPPTPLIVHPPEAALPPPQRPMVAAVAAPTADGPEEPDAAPTARAEDIDRTPTPTGGAPTGGAPSGRANTIAADCTDTPCNDGEPDTPALPSSTAPPVVLAEPKKPAKPKITASLPEITASLPKLTARLPQITARLYDVPAGPPPFPLPIMRPDGTRTTTNTSGGAGTHGSRSASPKTRSSAARSSAARSSAAKSASKRKKSKTTDKPFNLNRLFGQILDNSS